MSEDGLKTTSPRNKNKEEPGGVSSYRDQKGAAQSAEKEFFGILKQHGYDMEKYKGQLENIRLTNDYGNKIKVLEYTAFFFGWVGLGSCIIAFEFESHEEI